jgi:hypothetical protein
MDKWQALVNLVISFRRPQNTNGRLSNSVLTLILYCQNLKLYDLALHVHCTNKLVFSVYFNKPYST